MRLIIHSMDHQEWIKEYDLPVTVEEVMMEIEDELLYPVFLCRINGITHRLNLVVDDDCEIELLDVRDRAAYISYQTSISFLYITAVHQVLGKNVRVTVDNTLSKGLYTSIRTSGIDQDTLNAIDQRMRELAEQDLPLIGRKMTREELIEILTEYKRYDHLKILESVPDLDFANLYSLDNEIAVFYTDLVCSTRYLNLFELRRYKNGVILRYPRSSSPHHIPEFVEEPKMYEVFAEETRWDKLLGITFAYDLNRHFLKNSYLDLILLSEALHEKKIAMIAEEIHQQKKRLILIAGPSSSGKTTFARRLCIQLRVTGLKPLYLGTDDYFKERDETPLGPDGEKDFESLGAVDIELFTRQMNDLLEGKKVDLPEFDFIHGTKVYGKRLTTLESGQPIVIEGIHGLNPKLTEAIPDEEKYRIFISPLTQLNIDGYNRISTTDARMLRRMVRDNRTRGNNAAMTIRSWPKVRAGEDVNINPYNSEADAFFNSHCIYELAVLKKYAKPLLMEITQDMPEYPEAQRMLEFLEFFVEMPDDTLIPNNSIMREFIGGSVLV